MVSGRQCPAVVVEPADDFPAGSGDIALLRTDGGTAPQTLLGRAVFDTAPAWGLDGEEIAFSGSSDRHGISGDLYVMHRDGTGVTLLTRNGAHPAYLGPDAFVMDAAQAKPSVVRDNRWLLRDSLSGGPAQHDFRGGRGGAADHAFAYGRADDWPVVWR